MKELLKGLLIGSLISLLLLFLFLVGYLFLHPELASEDSVYADNLPVAVPVIQVVDPGPEPEPEEEPEEKIPEEEEPEEEIPSDEPVTLAFAGDVLFYDSYLDAYNRNGITAIADEEMLSHMQGADLFILNEEFPFSTRGQAMADKQYTFRIDPKYVSIFKDMGADIVTVANNHALDFGKDAFCDTLETLKEAQIDCIGGGYNIQEAMTPSVHTINGQSFAFFGATRVAPSGSWYATDSSPGLFQTYEPARLNAAIKEAAAAYDHVIVFVHWGIEKNTTPEAYQRTLAKGYIDAGADLIVGCHPHVLQGFEYYKDVPIIYSLGNYLFANRDGDTLLLEAVFSSEGETQVHLVPCKRRSGVLKRIQEPASLYQHLNQISFGTSIDSEGNLTH